MPPRASPPITNALFSRTATATTSTVTRPIPTPRISQGESPRDTSLHPNQLAAWTNVASLILNLDKTVTRQCYQPPADPAAFDKYYRETHIPLAKKIPGLRSYDISAAAPRVMAGNLAYLVAELTFDSLADIDAAFASPEGQATAGDLGNFAQAGVTLLVFDPEAV